MICPGRVWPSREFGYLLRSSARTRIAIAVMNRQSMAMVTITRIQDDFSSNALTSFALARPAGRSERPADPRSDLPDRSSAAASHTRKEGRISLWIWIWCGMCEPSHAQDGGFAPSLTRINSFGCGPDAEARANGTCAYGAGAAAWVVSRISKTQRCGEPAQANAAPVPSKSNRWLRTS